MGPGLRVLLTFSDSPIERRVHQISDWKKPQKHGYIFPSSVFELWMSDGHTSTGATRSSFFTCSFLAAPAETNPGTAPSAERIGSYSSGRSAGRRRPPPEPSSIARPAMRRRDLASPLRSGAVQGENQPGETDIISKYITQSPTKPRSCFFFGATPRFPESPPLPCRESSIASRARPFTAFFALRLDRGTSDSDTECQIRTVDPK